MILEMREHLTKDIIPFWKNLRDDEYGGYYGYLDYELQLEQKAEKGCILNSRILWFFSHAYELLMDKELISYAEHAYTYLKEHCLDQKHGGVIWSTNYDGTPLDTTKHTYNQAFAVYALSAYYNVSKKEEALELAFELFHLIEIRCRDEYGYLEAFDQEFHEIANEKLSENGVVAEKTMNTLLHVMEAYTELYLISFDENVREKLYVILDTMATKVYNKELHRLEVFFDKKMNSILDLHSYGHDIEASWLFDWCTKALENPEYQKKIKPITADLTKRIYDIAYKKHSLSYECDRGVVNEERVWWVQAEAVLGFYNGYEREPDNIGYFVAANDIWHFIKNHVIDERSREWFLEVDDQGTPNIEKPIVDPWKCPYHNGRMCMELIKREGVYV